MRTAFEIGRRAIFAQQRGLDVTSNNISNVNTPGYSRQEAILTEADPINTAQGNWGMGVLADKIRHYRENYLDSEIRSTTSRKSGFDNDQSMIQKMESAINEPSDYGIDDAFDAFYSSVEDLNGKPDDVARRNTFLSNAKNVADTFNSAGERLQTLRAATYKDLENSVTDMNRILTGIADLNKQIAATKTSANAESGGALFDKQTLMIEELSKYGAVQVNRDAQGNADVTMNGAMVVSSTIPSTVSLKQNVNQTTGEITASLAIENKQGVTIATYTPNVGVLASSLKHFNVTLDDKDSSNGFSLIKNLDELASKFAEKVNSISNQGYGLDDTGTQPPLRNIFDSDTVGEPISARNIRVSSNVAGKPRDLPVAKSSASPGDNTIFRALGELTNDATMVDKQTGRSFYGSVITRLANFGADARDGAQVSQLTQDQLSTQRESIIGVNLDEEALNMIKYQRAFEAAARIISVTSDLLSTVVNLGR